MNKISKLEVSRLNGKTQVEKQRTSILDAAQKLFLEKGLENTNMTDIAAQAGITRMSLYRYFSDCDPIAFEIAARMLNKIAESTDLGENPHRLEAMRKNVLAMIDQFYLLRDAYRFLGMFDHLYGDHYPNEKLAGWYRDQVFSLKWGHDSSGENRQALLTRKQVVTILNTIMSFLEKMAARGELLSNEQGVPLDEQLISFKEMINVYFDHLREGRP